MTRLRRRAAGAGRHRGQTLSEFALVIPLVILIFMGIFDLGRAVYAFTTISNAAREGARVLIVDQGQTGGVYKAQSEASGSAFALGIAPANVTVTFRSADLGST
jgi:Flp pilus assembly protein TadG